MELLIRNVIVRKNEILINLNSNMELLIPRLDNITSLNIVSFKFQYGATNTSGYFIVFSDKENLNSNMELLIPYEVTA